MLKKVPIHQYFMTVYIFSKWLLPIMVGEDKILVKKLNWLAKSALFFVCLPKLSILLLPPHELYKFHLMLFHVSHWLWPFNQNCS